MPTKIELGTVLGITLNVQLPKAIAYIHIAIIYANKPVILRYTELLLKLFVITSSIKLLIMKHFLLFALNSKHLLWPHHYTKMNLKKLQIEISY